MTILLVLCYVGLAAVIGGLVYQALELRHLSKRIDGKIDKRLVTPSRLRKHVPSNPVHQASPDGKERIVGYECSQCGDTSVSKGGHTVKQCEATLERLKQERAELAPAPLEEAHDPPMDEAPGAEEPSHDD